MKRPDENIPPGKEKRRSANCRNWRHNGDLPAVPSMARRAEEPERQHSGSDLSNPHRARPGLSNRRGILRALGVGLALGSALTPAVAVDLSSAPRFLPDNELDPTTVVMLGSGVPGVVSADGSMAAFTRLGGSSEEFFFSAVLWGSSAVEMTGLSLVDPTNIAVFALSADGLVAVGQFANEEMVGWFRWTSADGYKFLEALGEPPGVPSTVHGVSADAKIIVGEADANGSGFAVPVYWDDEGTIHRLLAPADPDFWLGKANLVSGDGKVIYGRLAINQWEYDDPQKSALVRWTDFEDVEEPGYVKLTVTGDSTFGFEPTALLGLDTSFDGSVLVGTANDGDMASRPFVWTDDPGTFRDLGTPGDMPYGGAGLVSNDGTVAAGFAADDDGRIHAIRWSIGDSIGLIDLSRSSKVEGHSRGADSTEAFTDVVTGMSADGSIIVGVAAADYMGVYFGPTMAWRWSESSGWQSMSEFLTSMGLNVDTWRFDGTGAPGVLSGALIPGAGMNISADGRVIIGTGRIETAPDTFDDIMWLVRCEEGDSCAVASVDDLYEGAVSVGATGEVTNLYFDDLFDTLSGLTRFQGTNGTVFAYGMGDTDPMASAGVGVALRPHDTLTAGISAGRGVILTPLANGGESRFASASIAGYFADRPESGLVWEAGVSAAAFEGTVRRAYLNGSDIVSSSGDTTGVGWGATGRVGWRMADVLPGTAITPYAGYTFAASTYNGWVESGGTFPAAFSGFTTTTHLIRVGAEVEHEFAKDAVATAGVALVRRSTDAGTLAFTLPGAISGEVGGETGATAWAEATLGLSLPVGDAMRSTFQVTGRLPSRGEASLAGQAGLSFAF